MTTDLQLWKNVKQGVSLLFKLPKPVIKQYSQSFGLRLKHCFLIALLNKGLEIICNDLNLYFYPD